MIDAMPRKPDEDPGDFLGMCCAVPLYALLANAGFTAGPLLERLWPIADPVAAHRRRTRLYDRGLLFSCALTALPFAITFFACVASIIHKDSHH